MKLNFDCVRDILLYCEEFFDNHTTTVFLETLVTSFPDYKEAEIISALKSLNDAGYLICNFLYGDGIVASVAIDSITFEGMEFLELIRPKSTWEKFKVFVSKKAVPSVTSLLELVKIFLS